jgi:uncharacterized membrane protein YeiH
VTITPLLAADLVGIAVFAASGASAGVAKRLDLFGVAVVGFVAALGGGILRDLLIGSVPPLAVAAFWLHPQVNRLRRTVLVLDAAGLGLFTVAGTLKALDAQVPPWGACVIGMITGIGGGLGRDLLTGEIPVVLRREIYAVAGLLGAVVVVALRYLGTPRPALIAVAAALVFLLRLVALQRRWSAPTPRDGLRAGDARGD